MPSRADRLWIGIPAPRLDAETAAHLDAVRPGGIVLFRRNVESAAQVCELIADLRARLGEQLLVVVDQEGGAVVRFEREATVFPGNLALGAIAMTDRARALDLARRQGRVSAAELRALGIDGNLAPVCDLTVRADNPGVGCRSFGGDPALAGDLAAELVRGHLEGGVFPVLKHFPGLGAADRDSHEALPRVGRGRAGAAEATGTGSGGTPPVPVPSPVVRALQTEGQDSLADRSTSELEAESRGRGQAPAGYGRSLSPTDAHGSRRAPISPGLGRALEPFRRAIAAGAPVVMTAHLVHDELDPARPATTSTRVVRDALRGRLRFDGAVMSDDLGMGALAELSTEEKIELAAAAGHDLLCVCHDPRRQLRARARLEAIGGADDEGAAARIAALRRTVGRLAGVPAVSVEPGAPLAAEIAERALTVLRRGAAPVAIPAGERWLLILPAARNLTQVEDPLRGEDLALLAARLADRALLLAVGSPPTPAEIARAAARSADLDGIVIATIGLRTSDAERQLVLGALEWQPRTIVIPLGDPAELAALPARSFTAVTAYGYRRVHQEALARLLRGEIGAAGRYPGPPEVARAARFDP